LHFWHSFDVPCVVVENKPDESDGNIIHKTSIEAMAGWWLRFRKTGNKETVMPFVLLRDPSARMYLLNLKQPHPQKPTHINSTFEYRLCFDENMTNASTVKKVFTKFCNLAKHLSEQESAPPQKFKFEGMLSITRGLRSQGSKPTEKKKTKSTTNKNNNDNNNDKTGNSNKDKSGKNNNNSGKNNNNDTGNDNNDNDNNDNPSTHTHTKKTKTHTHKHIHTHTHLA